MAATEIETIPSVSAPAVEHEKGSLRGFFRRRRFVVDRRYQFRAGLLAGVIAFVLLVLLNFSLYYASQGAALGAASTTPEIREIVRTQDRAQVLLTLLGSAVFLVGVVLIGILESHKTAGAAYRIRRGLDRLQAGEVGVRIRLRRDDHLQDLAAAVNDLATALREREARDLEFLSDLASRAEAAGGDPALEAIASDLRRFTIARRREIA